MFKDTSNNRSHARAYEPFTAIGSKRFAIECGVAAFFIDGSGVAGAGLLCKKYCYIALLLLVGSLGLQ